MSWVQIPSPTPNTCKIHVDSAALTHRPTLDLRSESRSFAPILRPSFCPWYFGLVVMCSARSTTHAVSFTVGTSKFGNAVPLSRSRGSRWCGLCQIGKDKALRIKNDFARFCINHHHHSKQLFFIVQPSCRIEAWAESRALAPPLRLTRDIPSASSIHIRVERDIPLGELPPTGIDAANRGVELRVPSGCAVSPAWRSPLRKSRSDCAVNVEQHGVLFQRFAFGNRKLKHIVVSLKDWIGWRRRVLPIQDYIKEPQVQFAAIGHNNNLKKFSVVNPTSRVLPSFKLRAGIGLSERLIGS
jgi:hypothetical protein